MCMFLKNPTHIRMVFFRCCFNLKLLSFIICYPNIRTFRLNKWLIYLLHEQPFLSLIMAINSWIAVLNRMTIYKMRAGLKNYQQFLDKYQTTREELYPRLQTSVSLSIFRHTSLVSCYVQSIQRNRVSFWPPFTTINGVKKGDYICQR